MNSRAPQEIVPSVSVIRVPVAPTRPAQTTRRASTTENSMMMGAGRQAGRADRTDRTDPCRMLARRLVASERSRTAFAMDHVDVPVSVISWPALCTATLPCQRSR